MFRRRRIEQVPIPASAGAAPRHERSTNSPKCRRAFNDAKVQTGYHRLSSQDLRSRDWHLNKVSIEILMRFSSDSAITIGHL